VQDRLRESLRREGPQVRRKRGEVGQGIVRWRLLALLLESLQSAAPGLLVVEHRGWIAGPWGWCPQLVVGEIGELR